MIVVDDLTVRDTAGGTVLDAVTVRVAEGAALGIVGESGSGKTTLANALIGEVAPGLVRHRGSVVVAGVDVTDAAPAALRHLRRHRLAHLAQDPGSTLTPTMRVGALVAERISGRPPPSAIAEALAAVGLPGDAAFQRRRPWELSGGQRQRVALARALACRPDVVMLDEPTTGLDTLTQDLVLTELERLRRELGFSLVVVSHDLAAVARLAAEIVVLRDGRVVDEGDTVTLLGRPRHPYTRTLVASVPDPRRAPLQDRELPVAGSREATPVLVASGLHLSHRDRHGRTVVAADDVSFHLDRAECVALLGPSGSGKTTIARALVGLHRPDAGVVHLDGVVAAPLARHRSTPQRLTVQFVAQDPGAALNPRRRVVDAVAEPLWRLRRHTRRAAEEQAVDLLTRVGLDGAIGSRRPGELSGGQRQRVAIARALAAEPQVLVADEITSALDVSVQADLLDLLVELRSDGLAVLLVTHDLGVVARTADRILVLDAGRICEQGAVVEVLSDPGHPLTRRLLGAAPSLSHELTRRR